MPNIFVLRVRNGFIVESRDYQGPFRAPDRKPIGLRRWSTVTGGE